jgi:Multimeric flavodoxin WrbA
MKVLLVNGSPHKNGCTYTALEEIQKTLLEEGIDSDIFWLGTQPISGCIACGYCAKHEGCAINDKVNEFAALAKEADGFVFGSPVHYAGLSGALTSFMDRLFYSIDKSALCLKPAAGIVSARRGGNTAAFDQVNKYFTISQMPVISSQYWNMVHGFTPDDVKKDLEGLQTMRTLARNMAWFLKCKQAGEAAGVPMPQKEKRVGTHFIMDKD